LVETPPQSLEAAPDPALGRSKRNREAGRDLLAREPIAISEQDGFARLLAELRQAALQAPQLGIAIAAIAGDFKGTVALEEKTPPQSYKLVVEGSGRQGFVKGHARVTLAADGDRTMVHIAAQADVGGLIARVGQRLLEGVARTMMDRFYACLAKRAGEL